MQVPCPSGHLGEMSMILVRRCAAEGTHPVISPEFCATCAATAPPYEDGSKQEPIDFATKPSRSCEPTTISRRSRTFVLTA